MRELAKMECVPCQGGVPALKGDALKDLQAGLDDGWQVLDEHHLERTYGFNDFKQALNFTNVVGEIAETQGHHPDIELSWGKVKINIFTHKIDGLTESDFILAAKFDDVTK